MTTEAAGPGLREFDPELQKMLRDLRELGCKRDEPCGVHDTPQWTCGLCLHNVLERVDDAHIRAALAEAKDDAPGHCENCRAAVPLITVHLCAICLPAAPSEHRAALAEAGRSSLPDGVLEETARWDIYRDSADVQHFMADMRSRLACLREGQDPPARASLPLSAGEPQ